ncbi:hypothetical protein C1I60_14215 [Paenibacillus terrae]|uniref:Uncharacterized protein n=1 Tax=Paenibacillus terrae TaxID=159743 RepID=A0A4U2Q1H4_9BACL|nr:hypothetical protein [Paenibacillus terrae]TKH43444.1 hypothetical protein C1I60_14215 [Paenibacillus terrae]
MSERTYKLLDGKELILDGDGLWMRHPELGIATMRVESVFGDLLALVDSLQSQLAERDRTIATLEQRMEQSHRDAVDARVKQEAAEDDRDELRKALEEIADSKNDMSGVLCRVTARKALRE